MSDTIRKDPAEEKTVVVKKSDIEQQLHRADEEKTVLDTVNEGYKSIFDPELEEILRETEGYELTPQDEDGEPEYEEEPEYDESKTVAAHTEMAVQVNGKLKGTVTVAMDSEQDAVVEAARQVEKIAKALDGMQIVKVIFVKNKLINLIVKPQ